MKNQIESFLQSLQTYSNEYYANRFGSLNPPVYSVTYGSKFARIVSNTHTCWGFIALKDGSIQGVPYLAGDLMKPASWNAPAKHSRGSILNNTAAYDAYGPVYLK